MTHRRFSHKAQLSVAEQLQPVKDAFAMDGIAHEVPRQAKASLEFPPLLTVDEIKVPGDIVAPAHQTSLRQLRSNQDHWIEFERLIERGEFAAAKTVVEFLDSDARLKAAFSGLYVKACLVIKREQISYAQAQTTAEKTAAEARQVDAQRQREQQEAARMRSVRHWLGRGMSAIRQSPNVAAPGLAAVLLLGLIGINHLGS